MKKLIETLRSKKTGYGHFSISIEMDGQEFKTTTTNTMAIDAALDAKDVNTARQKISEYLYPLR